MDGTLCSLYQSLLTDVFIPLAIVGALFGAAWFGVAYAVSGVFPELSGRMRQAPKNILIGLLALSVGPALISMVAGAFGIDFSCGASGGIGAIVNIVSYLM